jgi:hypothetical protein
MPVKRGAFLVGGDASAPPPLPASLATAVDASPPLAVMAGEELARSRPAVCPLSMLVGSVNGSRCPLSSLASPETSSSSSSLSDDSSGRCSVGGGVWAGCSVGGGVWAAECGRWRCGCAGGSVGSGR